MLLATVADGIANLICIMIILMADVIAMCLSDRVDCDEEYIGESSRTFGERFNEHLKPTSPIYDHSNITGHIVTINNFNIVGGLEPDENNKRGSVH